jgi:hypothetical protein
MKRNEIFFCDLIVIKDKKETKIENVVWMETETHHKKMEIKNIVKHKSLGFQSLNNGFTEVSKSNEKRNTITGAYD